MDDLVADDSEPPLRRFNPHKSSLADINPRSTPHADHASANRSLSLRKHSRRHRQLGKGKFKHAKHASDASRALPSPPSPPHIEDADEKDTAIAQTRKPRLVDRVVPGMKRFLIHTKDAIFHSWINVLLVFVPIGIAMEWAPLPQTSKPTIVFSMNAVAIVPLAGLLAYATETVASRLGDTLASLLNVTFGNAVELIIFIIALSKDEIRITQASILGSILANLLLILGMSFLLGGLRFQEQIYNNTVTQMSAVLLSLSVMSLLLPTAFHASFLDNVQADTATTKISRGVSVVLLVVYMLYLLFQLKSHAYLYASTPQQVIDEESHPGVLADILNSSSDSDSSSSDSDSSVGSHVTTKKRIKRAVRKRMRRKSSGTESMSNYTANSTIASPASPMSSAHGEKPALSDGLPDDPKSGYFGQTPEQHHAREGILSDEEAAHDHASEMNSQPEDSNPPRRLSRASTSTGKRYPKSSRKLKSSLTQKAKIALPSHQTVDAASTPTASQSQPRVFFSDDVRDESRELAQESDSSARNAFTRSISRGTFRGPSHLPLPRLLSNTVFAQAPPRPVGNGLVQNSLSLAHRPGPRRTKSLPDRLGRPAVHRGTSHANTSDDEPVAPIVPPLGGLPGNAAEAQLRDNGNKSPEMSSTAAVVLLLVTTGLVAFCAELLVEAIPEMVSNTSVSEAFIGLIILPIVGNAAEHVTAVTVAAKNKMDLAIGVAVGSSIQIALFITPIVVLLGWFMSKEMSLYFNLFETVSLFVTVFVTNFLILDGRSNYLEGSLLIAAYIIIAVSAFFYPQSGQQSELGGSPNSTLTHYAGPYITSPLKL